MLRAAIFVAILSVAGAASAAAEDAKAEGAKVAYLSGMKKR